MGEGVEDVASEGDAGGVIALGNNVGVFPYEPEEVPDGREGFFGEAVVDVYGQAVGEVVMAA